MKYSQQVWNQIKNISSDEIINALVKDGWKADTKGSAIFIYLHPDGRRVSVHYHPGKTYGAGLLKGLFEDIGWTVSEMKKLKLIK